MRLIQDMSLCFVQVYKRISNRPAFKIAYENYLESQNNLELC